MLSQHTHRYLTEHLQGQRSADETREILHLIDEGLAAGGTLVAEFDSVLHKVSQKIPGLTIDFEKLLASDEIECDPLISQGNLALLRLDAIYHQAFEAWTKSGGNLHTIKRITKPENPANYSDRTEQHVRTEETYPPDGQLLNQIVNITLSGFRIQATITHRREHLKNPRPLPGLRKTISKRRNRMRSAHFSGKSSDLAARRHLPPSLPGLDQIRRQPPQDQAHRQSRKPRDVLGSHPAARTHPRNLSPRRPAPKSNRQHHPLRLPNPSHDHPPKRQAQIRRPVGPIG